MAALTASLRRLLLILNAIVKTNQPWNLAPKAGPSKQSLLHWANKPLLVKRKMAGSKGVGSKRGNLTIS